MLLSTYKIHQLVQGLDPRCTLTDLSIACIVMDITLNQLYNPMRLHIRHKCGYMLARQVVQRLIDHHMTGSDWLRDDDSAIETQISFWLVVLVAQGLVTTKPAHTLHPYVFGPSIREVKYLIT